MKRYILFAIFDNKAKGGAKDYGASFSSPDQARIYLTKAASVYEGRSVTFQLFDCKKERAVSFDYKISKKKKVNPAFGIISRILAIIIVLGLIAALAIPFIIKHIKP